MEISNDDLARILGRIESKVDAQSQGLASLEAKVSRRLDDHESRLRGLEVANPAGIATTVQEHDRRIRALEQGAVKAGVISGVASSVAVAAIVELIKNKLGL